MKNFLFTVFTLSLFLSNAQLLDGNSQQYTTADSLRGSLRPERTAFDVTYYNLNLDINFDNQSINGFNDIHFKMLEGSDSLQIDLFDNMIIDSIVYQNKAIKYTRVFNAVFVSFPTKMKKGSQQKMTVYYHGKPIIANNPPWDGGFTWQKDEEGMPWLGVSCEGIGASLWWPNKDHLSDEPDSMRVTCTHPQNLKFVGNGKLEKIVVGKNTSTTWKVSYPINNYNVTLNIGNYYNFTDKYTAQDNEKLVLDYWVLPYNLEKAKKHFEQVKPMLACFENYFGKFPFWNDNYKLVETPYLGMEHQTAIAYGNGYKKGYAGRDYSRIGLDFDYIIIHETGHEYWGNLISAEDIADMWIHESFCTYSEALYVECMFDYNKAQEYVNAKQPHIGNRNPMAGVYGVNVEGDGDMYNKGMLFLNTLRHVVNNDELWFSLLKDMNKEFAYKTINANDVMFYFNRKTALNLTPIFNQYLYYADLPKLMYTIENVKGKNYVLKYKWVANVGDFAMPFIINIGTNEIRLNGSNQLQQYEFKKKKKDKVKFNQEQFYYVLKKY